MRLYLLTLWIGLTGALGQTVIYAEPETEVAQHLAHHYQALTPATAPSPPLSLEEGQRIQEKFIATLQQSQGTKIGYKVALTSLAAQKRFGISQPLAGSLLGGMLKKTGSDIFTTSGIRLMLEADLLVRVSDNAINQANTPMEILASLSEVIPFIEVPDLVYAPKQPLNAAALMAINAGARYGIVGEPIALQATETWRDRLAEFTVTLHGTDGTTLAEGKGSNLLGHPLQVVLWLRNQLQRQGIKLKQDDLISLGSLTRLIPAEPETHIRANYVGLAPDGPVVVEVKFK